MRRAFFASFLFLASGCALVAGLQDRELPDPAGGSADATTEVSATDDSGFDARVSDGLAEDAPTVPDAASDAPPDAPSFLDASADAALDAKADASDGALVCAVPPAGVACAADAACSQGCCVEAGICGQIQDCAGHWLKCDGPEDCEAGAACCSGSSSMVVFSVCGTCQYSPMCHSDCDCPDAEPRCCPYQDGGRYARCMTSCP